MPGYERLQAVTANMNAPTAVGLDKNEGIYVAESVNDRVLVYSQSGQYLETITGLDRPISVAVDSLMRVYVGNKDRGNVEVYDSGYNFLFKLGSGDGEFSQPNDIKIDGSGKVYVVDKLQDRVKIYNADGSYSTAYGSSGGGDGQFQNPTSVAIDAAAGELMVLDHKLTTDMYGNPIEGARIQVFDMSGGFKRSFSPYGNQVGQMFRPQHIAVDGQSRVYVTDSFHNVVIVYDNNGTYLGDVYNVDHPLRTPLGIVMGGSNRLFIASLSTQKVEVYGVDTYTQMGVAPLRLDYTGQEGGSSPDEQVVSIVNNGNGVLDWSAVTGEGWITVSDGSGSISPAGVSTVDVGVDTGGLSAGTYTGMVRVTSASGASEVVNVGLTVLAAPVLSLSKDAMTFTSTNGSVPAAQDVAIANTGAGALNWSAVKDRSWIVMDKAVGTAPDTMSVSVDVTSMGAGMYTGTITVTGEGALSSPAVIGVTLNIVQETGAINVTTNIAGGTFMISGAASYAGSGTSWAVGNAPVGTYAIVYGDIEGYTTPSSQNAVLAASGAISFHGEYVSNTGGQEAAVRNIILGEGPGQGNAGVVKVYKADGTETGLEFTAHGYGYGVNVAAGDINCDGVDEIITAPGGGANSPSEVRVYDRNGSELTNLRINAFTYKYGAKVASGDFNGDGDYEVVVGAGAGAGNPSEVRVYVYDSTNQVMVDSGINLLAYDTGYGVNVAVGDIDKDGRVELITSPGPGSGNRGVIRVWEVDTSLGVGQWSVAKLQEYTVSDSGYSVTIAGGDVNGDGYYEVVTGAGPDRRARDEIKIYDRDGGKVSEFTAYITRQYGVNVASGDLDNDGVAEVVAGAGSGEKNRAIVKVFDANGIEKARFKAFKSSYGVNVAVANLGL